MPKKVNKTSKVRGWISASYDAKSEQFKPVISTELIDELNERGYAQIAGGMYNGTVDVTELFKNAPGLPEDTTRIVFSFSLTADIKSAEERKEERKARKASKAERKSMDKAKKSGESAVMEIE